MSNIRLEPLKESHISLVEKWMNDPESRRRIGGILPVRAFFEYQQKVPRYYNWVAYDQDEFVGYAGFEIDTDNRAAVAILVCPELRKRGYGTAILKQLLTVPEIKPATEIYAGIEMDHEASKRCFAAAGFVNHGPDPEWPEFFRYVYEGKGIRHP